MQNKGALKLLTILLAIACAYQLSFSFVTRNVEKKAAKYAAAFDSKLQPEKEQAYLDSMKSQTVYNLGFIKFNYKECKEKEINLGLDLKGGMNVMLEISVEDVVRALSNDSKDPVFNQALAQAREASKNSTDDFISLFAKSYKELSSDAPLAFIFNTPALKEKIQPSSSNDEVIKVLRDEADGAISNSFNVLRNRIDRFGVTQPNIQRIGTTGRILVELPGVKEPERVRKLLQGTASLEFWATYSNKDIYPILEQANAEIVQYNKLMGDTVTEVAVAETLIDDELAGIAVDDASNTGMSEFEIEAAYPLFTKLQPLVAPNGEVYDGPVVGTAMAYDTAVVNKYLSMPQVKALMPRDIKLMWGIKAVDAAETQFQLYAIKANTRDGKAPLDGGVVTDATETYAEHGSSAKVDMVMNGTGARAWARLTADNINSCIAIVLDGYVYSAPVVRSEITGGRSEISGNFTIQEAKDLANVLKSGKLPAPARITQEAIVGPSLGADSIQAGILSFVIAFVLVLLYMGLYYNTAGWVANVALIANLFFLFGVLVSFGAVLTLPGIAGIVLSMGMAVDANVIIYERTKEELRAGKGPGLAVADGFRNAYSAILDGNITTIITGIVLFIFGTGPVQGFATTLIIGIVTSLFCAIFITRLILFALVEKGKNVKFSRTWSENLLNNTNFDFIGKRKIAYIISGTLIALTVISIAVRGFNYGVDFSGGRAYVIHFDQKVSDDEVREALGTVFEGSDESFEVKQYGSENQKRIVTQYKYDDQSDEATSEVDALLHQALNPLFVTSLTLDQFTSTQDVAYGIIQADKVGPSVAHDIKVNSIIAVLFSLLAIALYIIVRFKKWQWGVGAVVSLTHNALLICGLFSIFYGLLPFTMEVDQSFIAAILTIIGYSINDTVVIFDRIREFQTLYPKRSVRDNINHAVNSTLSRTINTSGTTIVTLLAIFVLGGATIRGFVFALLFGIIVGTYASVFVATPVAYDMMKKDDKTAK